MDNIERENSSSSEDQSPTNKSPEAVLSAADEKDHQGKSKMTQEEVTAAITSNQIVQTRVETVSSSNIGAAIKILDNIKLASNPQAMELLSAEQQLRNTIESHSARREESPRVSPDRVKKVKDIALKVISNTIKDDLTSNNPDMDPDFNIKDLLAEYRGRDQDDEDDDASSHTSDINSINNITEEMEDIPENEDIVLGATSLSESDKTNNAEELNDDDNGTDLDREEDNNISYQILMELRDSISQIMKDQKTIMNSLEEIKHAVSFNCNENDKILAVHTNILESVSYKVGKIESAVSTIESISKEQMRSNTVLKGSDYTEDVSIPQYQETAPSVDMKRLNMLMNHLEELYNDQFFSKFPNLFNMIKDEKTGIDDILGVYPTISSLIPVERCNNKESLLASFAMRSKSIKKKLSDLSSVEIISKPTDPPIQSILKKKPSNTLLDRAKDLQIIHDSQYEEDMKALKDPKTHPFDKISIKRKYNM